MTIFLPFQKQFRFFCTNLWESLFSIIVTSFKIENFEQCCHFNFKNTRSIYLTGKVTGFINLTKVHPGPCTRAFLITGRHVAWTVCIIWSCNFQGGPYQVWLTRWLLLLFASLKEWHDWLLPITALFYRVYLNTLDICLRWLLSPV